MRFRELETSERSKVNDFYQLTTYKRIVSGSDRVFVAENDEMILGAVRVEMLNNFQVLRGMYIHPNFLRQGIGSLLLKAIEVDLSKTDSYCIPRDHLFDFYGQAEFKVINTDSAPFFLVERLKNYINEGLRVSIMHRQTGFTISKKV